jgi:hypothetical protein
MEFSFIPIPWKSNGGSPSLFIKIGYMAEFGLPGDEDSGYYRYFHTNAAYSALWGTTSIIDRIYLGIGMAMFDRGRYGYD